nr:FeoA domain-containing protein [uncultured Tyzzerella sp.]
MKKLSNIKVGKNVKVLKVVGEGALKRRIMDMGITKDANIFVRKTAPLGDPIEISIRGYELTIRKEDAKIILVGECE